MNDIRRTILWVIFGFSLVMLWDQWQVHNGRKPTFLPSRTVAEAPAQPGGTGPSSATPAPVAAQAGTDWRQADGTWVPVDRLGDHALPSVMVKVVRHALSNV